MNILKKLCFSPGAIVVIDRGLVDYKLFGGWTEEGVYFVTRLKDNVTYRVVALLRLNLFAYRDLWEWIDRPIEPPPVIQEAEQLALSLV